MAYKEEIITQYNKFYEDYGNKHIDDYETFIRTRVIEYFFHLSQDSIDEITSFVNMVLDREKNNCEILHSLPSAEQRNFSDKG